MSNAVAKVSFLQGQAWAKAPDGTLRALTVGSTLNDDEILVTAQGARVELDVGKGEALVINGGAEVGMSRDFLAETATDANEALLNDASVQEALTVLERGGDLLDELEEPAAGNIGGGGEGHNFVQLTRIIETTDPLAFEYSSVSQLGQGIVEINAGYINRAPLVTDQVIASNEDEPVTGQIIADDIEGDVMTFSIATPPVNGALVLDPVTGQFTFTPNPNYNGSDSFVVTVTDSSGNSTNTSITLNIAPVNDAPTTNNINLTTNNDVPVNGQVVAQDIENDTLSYVVSGQPANGTVVLNPATGSFSYTPNAGYNGSDSFVVTISDGKGGTTTSRINIGINPVNDAPVSSDQNLTTPEDVALTGRVVATDIEGDTLAYAVSGQPANGSVSLNPATGDFVYTPNANYNGSDSFVVTVSDSNGGTTTSRITIGVTPVNDAPVANNVNLTTPEDTPLNGQIVASDVDGDTLSYALTGNPANGTVVLNPATGSFSYTPNAGYNGSDSFVVTISDGKGGVVTSRVSVGVNPLNDAPVSNDQNLVTDEDTPLNGQIVASDADGDTLSYALTGNPANGSVSLNPATGGFVYTPNANYNGSDSFTVTISDGNGGTTTSLVSIGVTPLNAAPTATNLNLTTDEDVPINGAISANDPDGDTLSYLVTGSPTNGSVVLNPATGIFTYTPNAGYNGSDSFEVTISDGKGGVVTSRVSVGVNPLNDVPLSSDQNLVTDEDTPLNGQILVSDADGDTLSYTLTGNPANGTVVLDPATGTFVYTPNANYNGSDSFVVTISDGKGGVVTSRVSVGINPLNDAPVSNDQNLVTDEDTPLNGQIVASDVDGDTLSYSISGQPANGTVSLNPATGGFVYTPNAGYNGSDSFEVTISDGKGGVVTSRVSVGVNPLNDVPLSSDQNLATDEDTPLNGQIVASDADGDTLSYALTGNPANGTVALDPATGTFVYTPNANYNGNDSFVVTISDGKGGVVTSRVSVGVNPLNDAPVSNDQNLVTDEDTPLNGQILASDADGDTLSYALTGSPVNGSVSLNPATGGFVYTPNAGYNGSDSFVVTISDGKGGVVTSRVSVGVNPLNDVPVSNDQNLVTDEDTPLNGQIVASDADGDTLSYALTGNPANGTVALDPATGTFVYTPNANYNGNDSFVVTISDGKGGVVTSRVSVGVNPLNDAPVSNDQNLVTDEDTPLNGQILASDADGDTLSYALTGSPANGTVALDPATGTFVYTPNANYNGSDSFVVTISDGKGGVVTSRVSVGVNPLNDVPVSNDQNLVTDEDTPLNGQIVASDADGDTLSYALTGNPANGTVVLDPATGTFVYTPNANYNGSDSFVVTISDGKGGTVTSRINIGVTPVNDAPVASNDTATVSEGSSVSIAVRGNDTDSENDSLTVSNVTQGANGSVVIDAVTGNPVYTPNSGFLGTDSFTYTIIDGKGGSSTATVNVTVEKPNTAPVAVDDPVSTLLSAGLPGSVNLTWSQPFISSITASGGALITSNADGVTGAMGVVGRGSTTEVDEEIQNGESILVTFNAPVLSARFGFSKLDFAGVPETGLWIAYLNGVEVGRGQFNPTDATRTGTVDIRDLSGNAIAFDQLKFDTAAAGSDYVVSWLTVGRNTATVQEGMSISIPAGTGILPNDSDSDGGTLVVAAVRTGAEAEVGIDGSLGVALQGAYGKLTLNADGSYSYTADNIAALHPGQIAKDNFTYTLSDGQGGTDKATLTISVFGTMGSDNQFYGDSGNETLSGTSGADIISGAAGNDNMTGGLGADTFRWALADKGTAGAPATDVIQDFSRGQGDVLHLSELLQGENTSNLTNYLHFTYDAGLNQTTVHVSSAGGYSGGYNAGATDQIIVLNSNNLSGTNQEIINLLKASGNLITD